MTEGACALYARVSSESQARDNTIASQVMRATGAYRCRRLPARTGSQLRG